MGRPVAVYSSKTMFSPDLPDNAALVAILQSLLQLNDAELALVAERSYLHVNQFVKIPLCRDAESVLRLHIWRDPEEQQQQQQNPHSHGWAFRSRVVRGSLTHTLFDVVVDRSEQQYTAYELDLAHPDGTTKMRVADAAAASLQARSVVKVRAGETYAVSRADIHTLAPDVPGCITLVQTERAHDDAAYVYSSQPQVQLMQKRQPLSVSELRYYLRSIIHCAAALADGADDGSDA